MSASSNFFSVMVVGDDPTAIMKQYDMALTVDPYIKYKYKDAAKMQRNALKIINEIVSKPSNFSLNEFQIDYFKEKKKAIANMSSFEYYQMVTNGLYYDENGNALSEENPNGKWTTCQLGNHFSLPLKLKDGKETYQSLAKNVDWDSMNMQNTGTYELVWDLVHGDKKPENDEEKRLYENMKNKMNYFSNFKNKEDYAIYNCAYWNYAYVDEITGWHDIDDNGNEMEWIKGFFNTYVKTLKPNDRVSIFECSRKTNI